MQVFADAPSRRRRFHQLRTARLEAQALGKRTSCAACRQRRTCAQVDPLEYDGAWYCLIECWAYFRGMRDGELAAAYTARDLITRELDRVFSPALVELRGWPRYRCDLCHQVAARFTHAEDLGELGWLELGRDAHLCPTCRPDKTRKEQAPRTGDLCPSGGPGSIAPHDGSLDLPQQDARAS